MNTANIETAKATEASTAQPSIKWTMKLKLKAAHQVLLFLGVTDALVTEGDLDRWKKTYELLVGSPPPGPRSSQ